MHLDRPEEASRFAMAVICQALQFLFLSLPGQKMMDHSLSIFNAA